MSLVIEAQKLALQFSQLLLQNSKSDFNEIISIYHEHFYNSRLHLSDWYSVFNSTVIKNLTDNNLSQSTINIIKDALKFEINLQENHLFKIRDVLTNNRVNTDLSFSTDCFISSYKFIYDYKNYFLTKHLYSILNNINKIIDVKTENFNFKELFQNINARSLTGHLFLFGENENNVSFKIPLNISTPFMFWSKNKLIGICTSIDKDFDEKTLLNNFINLHILYNKNPKEIQDNLKRLQPKKNKTIISKLSSDKTINQEMIKGFINNNIEFIFDLNIVSEYDSINKYEILTAYLVLIESDNNNGFIVPEQVNQLLFFEIVNQLGFSEIIDKEFREKTLLRILSTFKDYNSMIFNLSILPSDKNYFKDLLLKFFNKINSIVQHKKNNENIVKNYIFSKGINNKNFRENIFKNLSNKNIINVKEFFTFFKDESKWISEVILLLHSNHIDSIIIKSINDGLNDKQISNLIENFDKNIDKKKSIKRIDFFREQKELKKISEMEIKVKK